jgi:hypothetical protein
MASTESPETRHRIAVRILVVLASFLAFLAIFTGWVDRQALDTNEWTDTSGKLLEDPVISDAIANYSVDQLYANVDVPALLKQRLPKDLQPVAAPASAGLRALATRAAERAFQSPRVQTLWRDANRVAHSQLVAILEGKSQTVSSQNGKVILDLRPIVLQLADRLGLKKQANKAINAGESSGKLKPGFGQLEVADSEQLDAAKTVTRIIQGIAWLFTLGSVALFGIAVYLGAGRRWVVVLGYGLGLIAAGLAALAVKGALKGLFVDSLARTEDAKEPVQHAWDISTQLLHSIASTVIIYGILFVVASFLASPAGPAVSIRRALAPTLRERQGLVWSVFAGVALLAVIVFPPSGTRQLILTLVLIGLAGVGLEALRRKTMDEFPGAKRGDWMQDMRDRARRTSAEAGRRIGSAVRGLSDGEKDPEEIKLERLERLGDLKEKGVLTATEFRDEKKKVLSGTP